MNLEYFSQEELQEQIKEIFKQSLPHGNYRLFFFGSRVKGNNSPRSDIDLGIEGEDKLTSKLKLEIEEKLQNLPTLYKIDLVDFKDVSEDFKRKVLENVEYIQ